MNANASLSEVLPCKAKPSPPSIHGRRTLGACASSKRCVNAVLATGEDPGAVSETLLVGFTTRRPPEEERYGPNGVGSLHLAEYCIELAKALHEDPARRVWLQEFGASSRWMPVEAIPGFSAATIANALDCDHLWGLTWWCSHDLNAELSGFHPLEYDLGLFDQANREKPVAGRLREVIADARAGGVNPPTRTLGLVLPGAGLHGALPDWGFAARYMELIDQGERPAVVLEERAGNAAYLAARGIARLVFIA